MQEVRLVGENIEPGVFKLSEALRLADEFELDLVEISPNAEPPVCKIMDYKKFVYMQKKREKELKAKSTQIVVKEIRFGPQTDEHDYDFKRKNAENPVYADCRRGRREKRNHIHTSSRTRRKWQYERHN